VPKTQGRINSIRETRVLNGSRSCLCSTTHERRTSLFDREIALKFGVNPPSTFMLAINDKTRFSDRLHEALAFIYQVFDADNLVITWEFERIHQPRAAYPPSKT
jgi:hypothetical protein